MILLITTSNARIITIMVPRSTPNAQIFTTMCPPSKPKERMDSVIVPIQTTKNPTWPPPSTSNKDSTLPLLTITNNTQKVTTILSPSTSNIQTFTTMCPPQTPKERQQYDDDGAPTLKGNNEDMEVDVLFEEGAV